MDTGPNQASKYKSQLKSTLSDVSQEDSVGLKGKDYHQFSKSMEAADMREDEKDMEEVTSASSSGAYSSPFGGEFKPKKTKSVKRKSSTLQDMAKDYLQEYVKLLEDKEREDYVVVDMRNLRPLMMNYGDGQYYEKWQTELDAQKSADDLNRAYQKTYGAVEGPHVVMYKSDYFTEKRKEDMMEGKKRKLTKKPSSETSLRDWFGRKGAKGSTGGWVDCNAPDGKGGYKSCGRKEGESRKKYPACRPTPAACKSKGKGKKWGKKSKNESITEQYGNFVRWGELITEAEYKGRKVKLNKPTRGDVKKFKVYVKNDKGNVVKVNFGHGGTSAKKRGEKTMRIKKSNPERRKAFRARHNCDNPGPKWKARYWSCKAW